MITLLIKRQQVCVCALKLNLFVFSFDSRRLRAYGDGTLDGPRGYFASGLSQTEFE